MQPPDPHAEESTVVERGLMGLSFGDGFQFGCGFFMAGLIATIIVLLLVLLVILVLSLTGFSLFGDLLGPNPLSNLVT